MVEAWETNMIKTWSTSKIRNWIWLAMECGQPVPGCVSVAALRMELCQRGQEPKGYHST